jgi:hypothetical protein
VPLLFNTKKEVTIATTGINASSTSIETDAYSISTAHLKKQLSINPTE